MAPRQYARLNHQKQNDPINWPFFILQFFICIFALRAVSVSFAHHESKNFRNKGRSLQKSLYKFGAVSSNTNCSNAAIDLLKHSENNISSITSEMTHCLFNSTTDFEVWTFSQTISANNNSNVVETDGFTLFFPETSYGTDLAKIVTDFGRVRRHAGHHLSELPKWKNVILSLRGHLDTRNYTYPNSKPSFGISAQPGAFSITFDYSTFPVVIFPNDSKWEPFILLAKVSKFSFQALAQVLFNLLKLGNGVKSVEQGRFYLKSLTDICVDQTLSNTLLEILKTLDFNISPIESCPIEPTSVFSMQLSENGLVSGRDPAQTSEIFKIIGL